MNNYFSRHPHFVILAWVQSWNIFEKFMKVWNPLEFFHKNMSHKQFLFTWSTFRDSSMGTKLKYLWKTHESVKSARIFHINMSHEQLLFTWSTFRDSSMGTKLKYPWPPGPALSRPIAFNRVDMESLLEKWNRGACLQTPVDWHYPFGPRSFTLLVISTILTLLKNFCTRHWMGPEKVLPIVARTS